MSGAPPQLPPAVLKPEPRISAMWLLPVAMLAVAGWVATHAWLGRGPRVAVTFADGHGLREGASVRYRGTTIGEVAAIGLAEVGDAVVVRLRLAPEADRFARAGARYWIVRPQVSLQGVRGLETLLGDRYVAALPGEGAAQSEFVGLEDPLLVEATRPGDLEVVLESAARGNLSPGAPIQYREVKVGVVLSVGLAGDGRTVEARAHVDRAYARLIRSNTRFWHDSGVAANWGTKLLWMEFGGNLARTLLAGTISIATPEQPGEPVHTGHRFVVEAEAKKEWLEWQPSLVVGSTFLPEQARAPQPVRAHVRYRIGRLFTRDQGRDGWLLETTAGVLGPADLLVADADAIAGTTVLEAGGDVFPLDEAPAWSRGGVALRALSLPEGGRRAPWPWPPQGAGAAQDGATASASASRPPEDAVAFIGDPERPLPLPAHRMRDGASGWLLDPSIAVDPSWHGAAVLSSATGDLVGVLLVEDDGARVALVR